MKNFTIGLVCLSVCFFLFTGCGSKNGAEQATLDTTEGVHIEIAKSTGFIGQDEYYQLREKDPAFSGSFSRTMPVMNPSDRKKYQIDDMPISEEQVIYGKLIHQADTWRMESLLGYVEDHMMTEYLVIYDEHDKYVDSLEAGANLFYAGDMTCTEIEGDKITCTTEWYEPGSGGGKVYRQYRLTPQLTFEEVKRWEEIVE